VLTYEHGLLRTEGLYYQAMAGRAPVPVVVHADFSHEVIGSDFLLMTELPGTTWYDGRERIGDADRARLRGDLGGLVAALHQVTGTGFGYPQDTLRPTWREAFLSMVDAVLADAGTYAVALPRPADRIRAAMHAWAGLLDAVPTPVLVHFDLWEGNILVDLTAGSPRITGLVDGERAFWGDPLAELVSLALFEDIERDEPFLSAYATGGGLASFDRYTRIRLRMYRCYLWLIMLVEAVPRGFSGGEHARVRAYAGRRLKADLDELAGENPG
jgi:aminoglycoside phosphotransferase (APT) family kinase protein